MEIILPEEIDESAEYIQSLSPEESKNLIRTFKKKQSPLLVYTAALGERDFNNEEEDVFIFAVLLAWYCISQKVPDMRMVTIEQLESAEAESEAKLSEWEKAPDDSQVMEAMQMLSEQSQPTLFGFLLQTIMQSDHVREDAKGLMFLHMKIILNCLLEAAG
jgi:hypothetical protein